MSPGRCSCKATTPLGDSEARKRKRHGDEAGDSSGGSSNPADGASSAVPLARTISQPVQSKHTEAGSSSRTATMRTVTGTGRTQQLGEFFSVLYKVVFY
jgi:hypothetical protein